MMRIKMNKYQRTVVAQCTWMFIAFMFVSTSYAQIPPYLPTNGLVGWWPFNGNANDESGNGNHGTVNGATLAVDRNGNANSAYSFDGNSGITIPHSTSLNIGSSCTFSFWLKNLQKKWSKTPHRYQE